MRYIWAWVLMAILCTGCGVPDRILAIDLLTDLNAGVEFDRVDVALFPGGRPSSLDIPSEVFSSEIMLSTDARSARRIADVINVTPGTWTVQGIVRLGGTEVARTAVIVDVAQVSQAVTLRITRDCVGVECPGDGNPTDVACLSGRCVNPRCSPENPEFCPPAECMRDADCPASTEVACLVGLCLEGACGQWPNDTLCSSGRCDPSLGCALADGDAGADGGLAVGPDADAGTVTDAGTGMLADSGTGAMDAGATPDGGSMREAGPEAGPDIGPDAGPVADGGPLSSDPAPLLRWPPNGHYTGSLHAVGDGPVLRSLQPEFIWSAQPGAETYVLQVDESCSITDFRTCSFPSPIVDVQMAGNPARSGDGLRYQPPNPLPVSAVAPVGRHYFWRMRSCGAAGCSVWSEIRYLNVGRLPNDYDGDGYGDLAVGASLQDVSQAESGIVFVYYGGATPTFTGPDTLNSPDGQAESHFGTVVTALGDINGDGFSDLAVSAPERSSGGVGGNQDGSIYIYLGSATGFSLTHPSTLLPPGTPQNSAHFGNAISGGGDLNGDGFDDIVAARADMMQGALAQAGQVGIYFGRVDFADQTADVVVDPPILQAQGRFGTAVAITSDVDGDGYVDLIIGSHGDADREQSGRAHLYSGDVDSVHASAQRFLENPGEMSVRTDGHFGASVSGAGDVNGDGYADVVIGAPDQGSAANPRRGAAFLYFGEQGHLGPTPFALLNLSPQNEANFGAVVSGGADGDGDGFSDILVGTPGRDTTAVDAGNLTIYFGSDLIRSPGRLTSLNNRSPQSGRFGSSVAWCDMDGNGWSEVLVGAPTQSVPESAEGAVYTFAYSGDSLVDGPSFDNPTDQVGGQFGGSLAGSP